eukprot:TRINITY_DN3562_c0_g2_i4.p2 TRINITY_DN3562_c0_g2~~TRINITY_DN3562_c0_g2_i4.p2  ORF type:complete len:216 (+),score=48.13 TRINITY_DN3562_c0_g2_i4:54-701(+)
MSTLTLFVVAAILRACGAQEFDAEADTFFGHTLNDYLHAQKVDLAVKVGPGTTASGPRTMLSRVRHGVIEAAGSGIQPSEYIVIDMRYRADHVPLSLSLNEEIAAAEIANEVALLHPAGCNEKEKDTSDACRFEIVSITVVVLSQDADSHDRLLTSLEGITESKPKPLSVNADYSTMMFVAAVFGSVMCLLAGRAIDIVEDRDGQDVELGVQENK